jgi:RNA polymerase sigma-70 factor, ECF subfamily
MSPSEPTSLYQRLRAGEPVVEHLVAENLGRLQAFVRAHMPVELRGRETDGDLLQSICVDLIGSRAQFDFRGDAQFRAWMFTAARAKMIEKLRFHRRAMRDVKREQAVDTQLQAGLVDPITPTPSRVAAAGERAQLVEQAIAALPPDHREVVTLTHFAGLSPAEVAEHLGRSPDAVRMLLGRALVKLSVELRRLGVDDGALPSA